MIRFALAAALALAGGPAAAVVADYEVFAAGTDTLLGTFRADDAAPGPLLSASFGAGGLGAFDVLGTGALTPAWDPATGYVTGLPAGSGFGAVFNSAVFDVDVIGEGLRTCEPGACAFSLTDASDPGLPGEWYVDYLPPDGVAGAVATGFYEVRLAPVPVPAAGLVLLGALGALGALRGRRRRIA